VTDGEYTYKLNELDRLLNDPDVPMEPAKVWSLLAEISRRDGVMGEPRWQMAGTAVRAAL
jgi:hypothetical protein